MPRMRNIKGEFTPEKHSKQSEEDLSGLKFNAFYALGAKISKTPEYYSISLAFKLYVTKLFHSAWWQSSVRSGILEMWCLETCRRIMRSS